MASPALGRWFLANPMGILRRFEKGVGTKSMFDRVLLRNSTKCMA